MTCCVTCYFDSDSPYIGKCFFRLESCALNRNDRGLSFCYFFLVPFLHFDPLDSCNLMTGIFFRSADHYNNSATKISFYPYPLNSAIGLLSSSFFKREVYLCFFFFLKTYQKHMIKEFFLFSFFYLHKTLH